MEIKMRKNHRAQFHDYNGGVYFVTVCTKDKIHYFGKIYDSKMHLSNIGLVLQNNIESAFKHYKNIQIPQFVVMPNHFHAIIVVGEEALAEQTSDKTLNFGKLNELAQHTIEQGGDPTLTTHHNCWLGVVVSGIKAHVTRYAHANNLQFEWQTRYHDHVIRNQRECNFIGDYIDNNVARWDSDCYNDDE